MNKTHCDDYIHDPTTPNCLKYYLLVNRLPAVDSLIIIASQGSPKCFATHLGKRVRLVMASRMGDVGITDQLDDTHGYQKRVYLEELSDFSTDPYNNRIHKDNSNAE